MSNLSFLKYWIYTWVSMSMYKEVIGIKLYHFLGDVSKKKLI